MTRVPQAAGRRGGGAATTNGVAGVPTHLVFFLQLAVPSTGEEGTLIDHAQAVTVRVLKIEGTLSPWLYRDRVVDPRVHPNRSL